MKKYVGAIDQGTTSSRFILFDKSSEVVAKSSCEHTQIYPKSGWVEHNPKEIWQNICDVIAQTLQKANVGRGELVSIGIANQRETIVAWNTKTGLPLSNAIVWQDMRTSKRIKKLIAVDGINMFRPITGLPIATYFSASKIQWLLENNHQIKTAAQNRELAFGTMDSWILWNLTGGAQGGKFATDVTNASRTLLFNIHSLCWDRELLNIFGVHQKMLAEVKPSVPKEPFGFTTIDGPFDEEIPIGAILGDQQAASFGQTCFESGDCKNTYGTGCFILMNTALEPVESKNGLITTIAYKIKDSPCTYALEGSVAVAGSLVTWMRDNLGLIKSAEEIEVLAKEVADCGGVYFVPAFSGLFAPFWSPDARGMISGLTAYANKNHLARAALEATAFQTREIFETMNSDFPTKTNHLKVDGGMCVNNTLMQFQADILDKEVVCPKIVETTALGAAFAAGLGSGFWESLNQIKSLYKKGKSWKPQMDKKRRNEKYTMWKSAVKRASFDCF